MMDATHEKIGKYRIVSVLGKGAMGVVHKGLDPVIQRHVAIKTIRRETASPEEKSMVERFKREAQAAGNLHHPNIVSIYEYGEDGELSYIAMEYIDGSSLAEIVNQGYRFSTEESCAIMNKLLDALDHAHSAGVVHRDIKPANIMLTSDGEVKVADFGIAHIDASTLTLAGTILGTPRYMSPEQLMGQAVDQRSDIFSAGILFYEMLTGENAFSGPNIASVINKVINHALAPPSSLRAALPPAFDPIIARATAKPPDGRFESSREFSAAIADALAKGAVDSVGGEGHIPQTPSPVIPPAAASDERESGVAPLTPQPPPAPPVETPLPGPAAAPVERGVGNAGKKWGLLLMGFALVALAGIAVYLFMPGIKPEPDFDRLKPGDTFRDCADCPELVVIPSGAFAMGSLATEKDREANEGPRHRVMIDYTFAVGRYEVTRGEFARFVTETGHDASGCWTYDGQWREEPALNWQSPGFEQEETHPVTCVSWRDAAAYAAWLGRKTNRPYRLLSAAEWEYVARAGDQGPGSGAEEREGICTRANVADLSAVQRYEGWNVFGCQDGFVHTAPAGSFSPNGFGVHDMAGNVFEWVADCWNDNYVGAPTDGSGWNSGDCGQRILRGGSWFSMPRYVRPAFRNRFDADHRSSSFGFRVAREIEVESIE